MADAEKGFNAAGDAVIAKLDKLDDAAKASTNATDTQKAINSVPNTGRLTQRADEIHSVLGHPAARNGRTTAILQTPGGDIVGGGVRDLSPAQRSILLPAEMAAKLPGEHAEITVIQEALSRGLKPIAIGASRDFCPDCINRLQQIGANITGPRTAVWD